MPADTGELHADGEARWLRLFSAVRKVARPFGERMAGGQQGDPVVTVRNSLVVAQPPRSPRRRRSRR